MKTSGFESASSSGSVGGDEGSGSLILGNLCKLILLPLGVLAGGHAQPGHAGHNDKPVISPLDSRCRSVIPSLLSSLLHASPWRHGSRLNLRCVLVVACLRAGTRSWWCWWRTRRGVFIRGGVHERLPEGRLRRRHRPHLLRRLHPLQDAAPRPRQEDSHEISLDDFHHVCGLDDPVRGPCVHRHRRGQGKPCLQPTRHPPAMASQKGQAVLHEAREGHQVQLLMDSLRPAHRGDAVPGALRGVPVLPARGQVPAQGEGMDRRGDPGLPGGEPVDPLHLLRLLVHHHHDHRRLRRHARPEHRRDDLQHLLHALQPRPHRLPHRQHGQPRRREEQHSCCLELRGPEPPAAEAEAADTGLHVPQVQGREPEPAAAHVPAAASASTSFSPS